MFYSCSGDMLFSLFLFVICYTVAIADDDVDVPSAAVPSQQPSKGIEFEAIRQLHKLMDDDLSGAIDLDESLEFVQEELNIVEDDVATSRQKTFLAKDSDSQITLEEMWNRWIVSEEHNWTHSEVMSWLADVVELSQYAESFSAHNVAGLDLPKLAVVNLSYMVGELGITSPVHRQKIAIKSMDVILFGHKAKSRVKDYILGTLVTILMSVAWFFMRSLRLRDVDLKTLQAQMASIQSLESEMQHMKHQKVTFVEKDQEVNRLKNELDDAQKQIKHLHLSPVPVNSTLRQLLIATYQKEHQRLELEWKNNMQELNDAKHRLQKKTSKVGVMSQMLAAYSTVNDPLDVMVTTLKTRFDDTRREYCDCHDRWRQIEKLCYLSIIPEVSSTSPKLPDATPKALRTSSHEATSHMMTSKSHSNFSDYSRSVSSGSSSTISTVHESDGMIISGPHHPRLHVGIVQGQEFSDANGESSHQTDELESIPENSAPLKISPDLSKRNNSSGSEPGADIKKKKLGFTVGKKKSKINLLAP